MPCQQCGRNALFVFGTGEEQILLCLDCGIKFQNMQLHQAESHRREMNYLTAEFENTVGLPGHFPKYEIAQPAPIVNAGEVMLNNININNSQLGVVNTGTIAKVDASLTMLKVSGEIDLAESIKELTEAIVAGNDIAAVDKSTLFELLDALGSEACAPLESRRKSVAKAMLDQIQSTLKSAAPYVGLVSNLLTAANIVFGIAD